MSGTDIVDVRAGGAPLVSRIGVRVRDLAWGTVDTACSEMDTRETDGGFEASATCRSSDGQIDFDWTATISGDRDGVLSYELRGAARREFEFARVGLCVLLPAGVYAGRQFRAAGGVARTGTTRGRLPELVAPPVRRRDVELPLFPGFRKLDVQLADVTIWIRFEGDILELEDQRNWTDGTFKIYSSSVSDPLPRRMRAGQEVHQHLSVGLGSAPGRARRLVGRTPGTDVRVLIGAGTAGVVPSFGARLDHDDDPAWDASIEELQSLGLAHVRVELRRMDGTARGALIRGAAVAGVLGAELELVLFSEPGAAAWPADLEPPPSGTGVARLIVVPPIPGVSAASDIERARAAFPAWLDDCPVFGGTDSDFAELNVARPDLRGFDGLTFAMNPQVHDTDEQALVESLVGQGDAARTAASFAHGLPVCVSPITLKPRPGVDVRQPTGFAAAWTLGSVRKLAEAAVSSLTYFELTGPAGLIGRPPPDTSATPYPVTRVIAHVCAWRGRPILELDISDESSVTALAVNTDQDLRALVANLSAREVTVVLLTPGASGPATLEKLVPLRGEPKLLAPRDVSQTRPGAEFNLRLDPFSVALFSAEQAVHAGGNQHH